ncbi:uncharacterized protein FTOL_01475 [Fusarium torulosum]|uniref:BZIP domain-containing protein n=1 Tax=Fusarium torulosum TaxID=33205 RepID=A0AAE8SDP2_9HYPO|nr:uncharacterized protein FTOL_01475 [Fusarium torulosum]
METISTTHANYPPTQSVRRRGRPRIDSSCENETVMTRRGRNRQAQYVYRLRREAAQKDQTSRLLQLERAIEGMSSCIEAFTKEMLSLRIVKQHRELLVPLREMTTTVLALATETDRNDSQPPNETSPSHQNETKDNKHRRKASHGGETRPVTHPHSTSSKELQSSDKAISMADTAPEPIMRDMALDSNQDHSSAHRMKNLHMEQWLLEVKDPAGVGFTQRLPLQSLAYKLVHASLTIGLKALTQPSYSIGPRVEESRIFGSVLDEARRAYLIYVFEWLLGPGIARLYDCAKLSFVLNQVSQSNQPHPTSIHFLGTEQLPLLSVMDIESRLVALGARIQDQEFIELEIENPTKPKASIEQHFFSHSFNAVPPKTTTMTIRLSVSRLVVNLSKYAVCSGRGPAFFLHHLGMAIEASVIAAHGGLYSS